MTYRRAGQVCPKHCHGIKLVEVVEISFCTPSRERIHHSSSLDDNCVNAVAVYMSWLIFFLHNLFILFLKLASGEFGDLALAKFQFFTTSSDLLRFQNLDSAPKAAAASPTCAGLARGQ